MTLGGVLSGMNPGTLMVDTMKETINLYRSAMEEKPQPIRIPQRTQGGAKQKPDLHRKRCYQNAWGRGRIPDLAISLAHSGCQWLGRGWKELKRMAEPRLMYDVRSRFPAPAPAPHLISLLWTLTLQEQ
ncbi:hypothetical protein I79_000605 [Cricetulus griseus]|uniref:Uncharacterized protein n=1 Tax=Cricetulus griseus TaxID=10029 RepID=G3GSJ0_CRIGR|nr:hypothetical protein I79_000605 [Cricetulus griseus]